MENGGIMTSLSSTHDQLYKFLFDDLDVRGEIVQIHDAYTTMIKGKNYPRSIEKILAQLVLVSNLITVNMKTPGDVTVEIRGEGLLRYAAVSSDMNLNFRGIARHGISDPDQEYSFRELVGENSILLITNHASDGNSYQGVVEVTGFNLSDTLENYFARSEQIDTKIMVEIDVKAGECFGAAIMLQALPPSSPERDPKEDFNTVRCLLNTLTKEELLYLDSDEVLFRLFNEFAVRRFDAMPVRFKCACSREKCLSTLHSMGEEDIRATIGECENNVIIMTCSQCNTQYQFTVQDIDDLFSEDGGQPNP